MTDNELLATRIMGWTLKDRLPPARWVDKDGCNIIRANSWHPDTNQRQAMQVVEAMRVKPHHYEVRIDLYPTGIIGYRTFPRYRCTISQVDTVYARTSADRLETAIHAAAVQVARMMEATNAE